jgi:hypothetical protein
LNATDSNGGTQIYYDGWGSGQPVGALHGMCTPHKNGAKEKRLALTEA